MNLADFFINIGVKDAGAVRALNAVDSAAQRTTSHINSAAASTGSLGSKFAGLSKGATMAAAGLAAVAVGIGAFMKNIVTGYMEVENLKVGLATIEGSSASAEKSFAWIKKFAKETPYEMMDVADSFKKLKSYGLDPVKGDLLKDIGNMSSAMSKPLDAAVEAIADATTGEFERLKEFGIKASKQSGMVTMTYNKDGKTITKTVKNTTKDIQQAFQEISKDRFSGGMEAQSKTMTGILSNISDTWEQFKQRIAEGGGFDKVKEKLQQFADWLSNNQDVIDMVADNIGYVLVPILVGLTATVIALTAAVIAFNVAMWANPITWVVALVMVLIAAIIALGVWIYVNRQKFIDAWNAMKAKVAEAIAFIKAKWDEFVAFINAKIEAMKAAFNSFVGFLSSIDWLAPLRPLMMGIDTIIAGFNKITGFKAPSFGTGGFFGGSASPTSSTAPSGSKGFAPMASNSYTNNITVNAPNASSPNRIASLVGREISGAGRMA